MCGILFARNFEKSKFLKSLDMMTHRGPDDSDFIENGNDFLGHRRLSIIDLDKRSSQPFIGSDKKTVIIFNGEIYNFKELKNKYKIITQTNSDTEVLLELFIILGSKVLDELIGMFSFVIYNIETQEYFVARDRLGIKPLYYYSSGDSLVFSSEMAPILNFLENYTYDINGIRQYIKARTFFRGHTLYNEIKMFPPGCFMQNGNIKKYWDLTDFQNNNWNDEELKHLINDAILCRKVSDVKLGCYLSGGIDSSIISVVANEKDVWSVGFAEDNEFEYSELVANKYNFDLHKVFMSVDSYLDIAKNMILQRKEPLSVPNEVSLYLLTKEVKKKNTVILSGEGADELFLGYDRIFSWAAKNDFSIEGFDRLYSYGSHTDNEILEYILEPYNNIQNNLLKVSTFFQLSHLHGLLRRLDNSTMLCSVEARVPFVDHRLVEYMYNAPLSYRMTNGLIKAPLKRIYKDKLPIEIINRKKVGFPVPLSTIFNDKNNLMDYWLDFNMEVLLSDSWNDIKHEIFKGN